MPLKKIKRTAQLEWGSTLKNELYTVCSLVLYLDETNLDPCGRYLSEREEPKSLGAPFALAGPIEEPQGKFRKAPDNGDFWGPSLPCLLPSPSPV